MKQIIDRLSRTTLIIAGVWMVIATAVSLAAVALSFQSSRISALRVRAAMDEVMKSAAALSLKHVSAQDAANQIAAIGQRSGLSVTVFNDAGKRLAGDYAATQLPLPVLATFPPGRVQTQKMLLQHHSMMMVQNSTFMAYGGVGPPGMGPIQFGDAETNSAWLRIPIGFALIRLLQPTADIIERDYVFVMIALLLIGLVAVPILQRRSAQRQLAPFGTVESALRRLGEGDYSKIEIVGDEPRTPSIVGAYNAAADRVSAAISRQAETESNMRQFVAEAGHELRTPLTVLMGFIEVLQEGAIKEYALAQRILESVAIEGQRMRALILKLLLLARLDAAGSERNELVDVSAIAHEVVKGFTSLPGGDRITLSAESGTYVNATSSEVRELVGNLLDNALKHAPGSETRATVSRMNGVIELSVVDDGPGMMPELRRRAFERFTRGDDSGSVPGSGLGLAIVKRIVDRAEGTVELDSAPGKGTKVVVRLPAAQVETA